MEKKIQPAKDKSGVPIPGLGAVATGFYFKSHQPLPEQRTRHNLFKQLIKPENTWRSLVSEDLITHPGLDYYRQKSRLYDPV